LFDLLSARWTEALITDLGSTQLGQLWAGGRIVLALQPVDSFLAPGGLMVALFLHQQQASLPGAELASLLAQRFVFATAHLPVLDLLAQLFVGDGPVAGDLVDPKMLVQILEVILLNPPAKGKRVSS
jgi:hypothetical protein